MLLFTIIATTGHAETGFGISQSGFITSYPPDAGVIALSAWEDDPTTSMMDGYKPGDKMVLKIWHSRNQTEPVVIAHFSQGDGAYASEGYAVYVHSWGMQKPGTL